MESVRDHWDQVCSEPGYLVPGDVAESLANVMESVAKHSD
jgi:hypothetical protein